MKTYRVGRSKNTDITITDPSITVSHIHLELTEDTNGKYYVVDCNSTNGTYYRLNDEWVAIKQKTCVDLNDPLLLGKYQTSVRKLLAIRTKQTGSLTERNQGGVERNPETGEIMLRSK